ncbi:hypothetical protein SEMRO_2615_G332700.1 [Seminavis robusta]|uniref:Uncharacterized protein n=1 Tax=Seminavis robusta TaxID=568900 RepID=A0A9N8EX31_9STRA|nr:hypothetical protein SEMRO_2615_G332700.1 [Seminavis robusta]|eukprot:Sro2615_g332700.1 n/a (144) ;mRNA; f:8755-9186
MANIDYRGICIHEDIERPLNAVMSKDLSTAVKIEFHLTDDENLFVVWFAGDDEVCAEYVNEFDNHLLRGQFMTALTALSGLPFKVINHDMDDVADDAGAGVDGTDDDTIDDAIDFPSDAEGTIDLDDADTDDADDTETDDADA